MHNNTTFSAKNLIMVLTLSLFSNFAFNQFNITINAQNLVGHTYSVGYETYEISNIPSNDIGSI